MISPSFVKGFREICKFFRRKLKGERGNGIPLKNFQKEEIPSSFSKNTSFPGGKEV